jgi:hypothetical protein
MREGDVTIDKDHPDYPELRASAWANAPREIKWALALRLAARGDPATLISLTRAEMPGRVGELLCKRYEEGALTLKPTPDAERRDALCAGLARWVMHSMTADELERWLIKPQSFFEGSAPLLRKVRDEMTQQEQKIWLAAAADAEDEQRIWLSEHQRKLVMCWRGSTRELVRALARKPDREMAIDAAVRFVKEQRPKLAFGKDPQKTLADYMDGRLGRSRRFRKRTRPTKGL